jgi:mRNA-degrading endonuclease YafQ of YafQ-DinJ toxin-antitoxin module
MKRILLQSTAFIRAARRLMKKNPEAASSLKEALGSLADDAFQAPLKTHKLKGELAGSWACSSGYDLRITFEFVQHKGNEAVPLQTTARTTKFIK